MCCCLSLAQLMVFPAVQLSCCFPTPAFHLWGHLIPRGICRILLSPCCSSRSSWAAFIFSSSTEQLRSLTRDRDSSCCIPGGRCVHQLSQTRPHPWIGLWKHKAGKAFTIKNSSPYFLGQNWDDERGKMYLVCVRKEAVHRAWDFQSL